MSYKIYGKGNCGYCVKARELLESRGIGYEYVDVASDAESLAYIKSLGATTVPQIFESDTHVGGYTELMEYLD